MARTLDVYIHRQHCGTLKQTDSGRLSFAYSAEWLVHPDAAALSQSLPLRAAPFAQGECRAYFGGILPEQTQRELIAKNLGISSRNDFAMLEGIGGECAGAVTLLPSGEAPPNVGFAYRTLDPNELAESISRLPLRPLLAGDEGIRLSLAGAQPKLAVRVADGAISIPLGSAPSTHILKPAIAHFKGIVSNEALCMRLAGAIGLNAATVTLGEVEGLEYLLVERFDRAIEQVADQPVIRRLHQEDFCQALGVVSELKYQSEGGPSLKQMFGLLRTASTSPVVDLQALLNAVIFNFLVGNCDAHGKNFSLLYGAGTIGLAPLYDLVCTAAYPELSPRMAMRIGSEYAPDHVFPRHFEQLATEAGLSRPLAVSRVAELAKTTLEHLPEVAATVRNATVEPLIRSRSERVLHRFQGG